MLCLLLLFKLDAQQEKANIPPPPEPPRCHDSVFFYGEQIPVYVRLPDGYDTLGTAPPVIFVLDGESRFEVTRGIVDYLSYSARLPPAIVVGIPNFPRESRDKNLLPPAGGGEADRFLLQLTQEIIPHTNEFWETSGEYYLVGHSHGAVFTLYAFLERPDLFKGFLASDPSVKPLLDLSEQKLRERYDGQRLYLASSDIAYGYAEDIKADIHTDQKKFRSLLETREPQKLDYTFDHIADDHGNAYVTALSFGLRYLFFGWERPK